MKQKKEGFIMTKTYEHAVNIFLKRHAKIVETNRHKDYKRIITVFYNEFNKLYEYINDNNITYACEDELCYLKVRYLIEKFRHYYEKGTSYINKWRLVFIYTHIMILIVSQQKRQNKRQKS